MKLFLASLACQSLGSIKPLLPVDKKKLTVAFIPTASDTYMIKPWIAADRLKLMSMGFRVTDYDIKNKDYTTIKSDLSTHDIIFVCGGNTYYLLHQLRITGGDRALRELIQGGKIYASSSAGSCVLGPDIDALKSLDHPEEAPDLISTIALGIIDERIVPHYGRDKYYDRHVKIKEEWGEKVLFLSDDQALIINEMENKIVE